VSEPVPSTFDAALASAFGHELAETSKASPPEPVAKPAVKGKKPVTKFRTADPDPRVLRRGRAGGPVVELEASLVRGLEPIEPAGEPEGSEPDAATVGAASERSVETESWRRTAMAELTALATDSDDLTPRRRR
jgi:hypothetical protein